MINQKGEDMTGLGLGAIIGGFLILTFVLSLVGTAILVLCFPKKQS